MLTVTSLPAKLYLANAPLKTHLSVYIITQLIISFITMNNLLVMFMLAPLAVEGKVV